MEIYDDDTEYISTYNNKMALASLLAVVGAGASGYLWYRAMTPSTRVEVARIPGGATIVFGAKF